MTPYPDAVSVFLDQDAPMRSIANMAGAVKDLEAYLDMAEYRNEAIYSPYVVGLDGVYLVPMLDTKGILTGQSETFLNPLYATRYAEMQAQDIAAVSHNAAHINFKPIPLHEAVEDALIYYRATLQRMQTLVN